MTRASRFLARWSSPSPQAVIYPGLSKTGTTAFQIFLRCLPQLHSGGDLHYTGDPLAGDVATVGSGNGVNLAQAMKGESVADVREQLNAVLSPAGTSVISSEFLGYSSTSRDWQMLARASTAYPHTFRVVVVVRDLYPFAWSAYQQWVKRHGFAKTFESCVAEEPIDQHLMCLEHILSGLATPDIRILRYEEIRNDLVSQLLEAGAIRLDPAVIAGFNQRTRRNPPNRSLTLPELGVVRALNAVFGERYSMWTSDALIASEPSLPLTLPIERRLVDIVHARFGARLKTMSARLDALQAPTMAVLSAADETPSMIDGAQVTEAEIDEVLIRLRSLEAPSEEFAGYLRELQPSSLLPFRI